MLKSGYFETTPKAIKGLMWGVAYTFVGAFLLFGAWQGCSEILGLLAKHGFNLSLLPASIVFAGIALFLALRSRYEPPTFKARFPYALLSAFSLLLSVMVIWPRGAGS